MNKAETRERKADSLLLTSDTLEEATECKRLGEARKSKDVIFC